MTCFRRFWILLKYDLKNGVLNRPWGYAGAAGLAAALFGQYSMRYMKYAGLENAAAHPLSYADYLLYCFSGCCPHMEPGQPFLIPITWMVLFLYPLFLTINYPLQDLSGNGIQIIFRTGGRVKWYLSKCFYIFGSTLCYFLILHLTLAGLCLLTGQTVSFSCSASAAETLLDYTFLVKPKEADFMIYLLLMPFIVSLTTGFLQFTLALFIKRLYAFLFVLAMLAASAYFSAAFLPGVHAMLIRSCWVMEDGAGWREGMLAGGTWIFLSFLTGALRIRRYSIL